MGTTACNTLKPEARWTAAITLVSDFSDQAKIIYYKRKILLHQKEEISKPFNMATVILESDFFSNYNCTMILN